MGVPCAGVFSEFIPVYFFILWPGWQNKADLLIACTREIWEGIQPLVWNSVGKLDKWPELYGMQFSKEKHNIVPLGRNNKFKYEKHLAGWQFCK